VQGMESLFQELDVVEVEERAIRSTCEAILSCYVTGVPYASEHDVSFCDRGMLLTRAIRHVLVTHPESFLDKHKLATYVDAAIGGRVSSPRRPFSKSR